MFLKLWNCWKTIAARKCLLNFLSLNYSRNGTLKGDWRLSWHAKAPADFEILAISTLKSHSDKALRMPDIRLWGKDCRVQQWRAELVLSRAELSFYRAPNTGPACWPIAFQAGVLFLCRALFYSEMTHAALLKEAASIVEQAEGIHVTAVLPTLLERVANYCLLLDCSPCLYSWLLGGAM